MQQLNTLADTAATSGVVVSGSFRNTLREISVELVQGRAKMYRAPV
jgi:hypothetical protein